MKLWEFNRKNVVITLKNGSIVSGFVQEYCCKDDNDEEIDSIGLDVDGTLYEYFEDEILSISVAQRLEQSRRFYLPCLEENTMKKDLDLYGNIR